MYTVDTLIKMCVRNSKKLTKIRWCLFTHSWCLCLCVSGKSCNINSCSTVPAGRHCRNADTDEDNERQGECALHCGVSLPSICTCPCCLLQLPEAIHLQLLHMTSAELCQPLLLFPRPAAHVLCARAPGAVMIAVRARLPAW